MWCIRLLSSTGLEKQLCHPCMPIFAGVHQCCFSCMVYHIHIYPGSNKQLSNLNMAYSCCIHQRRTAVIICNINSSAIIQKKLKDSYLRIINSPY